ncbi:MAG: phosphoribosyltransferase [Thermoplasmata archaeon]|nr:phosphoribosyltransferase [Thermoplasmata archaeon]MEA3166355.1 phosphoribosyltransferase [Thermoplasmata archaeon]
MATRPEPAAVQPIRPLRLAVPNKGRLAEDAVDLLRRAGIVLQGSTERKLFASALGGRLQVLFLRAQDIPEFVADGTVDAGMTGLDVVKESGVEVSKRLDLGFGSCRLVLAVPEASPVQSPKDVPAGTRIATSFPNLAKAHFAKLRRKVRIVPVSGACEVTPMLGVADAIVDLTSSGSTLAMNHLREAGTLLQSSCHLIAARKVDPVVREELDRLQFALESVLVAIGKRYLLADLPRKALKEVQAFLPGVAGPTVVDIAGKPQLVAIQVVVDEREIYDAVHRLRKLGGTGILVVPIDRMVA